MTFLPKIGDWCVVNGLGADLSKQELQAIWEVERIQEGRVTVKLARYQLIKELSLGRRSYPIQLLTRYPKKAVQDAEEEF